MTEATRIQVAYDDRYIYIAILCEDGTPGGIAAGLGRRDELPSSDYVSVGFDPRHDHLTGYVFRTNPSAVQLDFAMTDDDRDDRDYNAVWEVRTQIGERGWTAELRIPFSQMRFAVSPAPGQVWGFQAERWIRRKAERGTLGLEAARRARRGVALRPPGLRCAADALTPPRTDAVHAHARRARQHSRHRGNVRLRRRHRRRCAPRPRLRGDAGRHRQPRLRPGRTGSGGAESQRLRNLLPGKTPLLPRGQPNVRAAVQHFQLFHSRRIGRTPTFFDVDDDDEIVDRPDDTTILGAAKVTG